MPMLQLDAPEHELPSTVVVPTEASIELLEAPKRKLRRRRNMLIILWTLLLVFGIMILLVRTPLHAPPFDSLTQYVCDPLPRLPNLGNRSQSYALRPNSRRILDGDARHSLPQASGRRQTARSYCTRKMK